MIATAPAPTRTVRRTCTAQGCQRPHDARGLCTNHYYHLMRKKPYVAPVAALPVPVVVPYWDQPSVWCSCGLEFSPAVAKLHVERTKHRLRVVV